MTGLALALWIAAAQTAAAQNGMLQPGSATYSVAASGGSITIPITRVAGSAGVVGCSYATVNGTAIAGTDYVTTSGTLSWSNGNTTPQNVVITIKDDGIVNGNKTFYLQLSLPTGGAYLGVPPTSPATNQEGRVLGTTPSFSSPLAWNNNGAPGPGVGDGILQTLQILPANNPWNEDITGLPVSPDSATIIAGMGGSTHIHVNRDMNLTIVPGAQATKPVTLTSYGSESDPGPYPIPDNTPIEGFLGDDNRTTLSDIQQDINPGPQGGDRHATIIDPVNGYIYEFGNTIRDASFNWTASGEATFNLFSNTTRQAGWTSADAAGLPILPSITRYDECQRGMVEHAIRFTASSRADYVWPATHLTGSYTGHDRPRMGERFRLKNNSSVNAKIALMSTHPKAIALALQKYGMFMADNGSTWYISTNSDNRLASLNDIQTLVGDDFEVVVTTGPNEGPRATSTAAITVTDGGGGGGGDVTPPTISVTSPTNGSTYSTSSSSILFAGTAADNVAVGSVTWTNSTGGSGIASGTTAWSALIAFATGTNTITLTAHDTGGNNTSTVVTVTYTPPPPGSPAGGGGGGGGGGCGLNGLEILPLLLLRRWRRSA
ncbi:MAG TPA: Calx-beta domain-containing protein [Planctomycetota bacterium]|nr:Calx-beta domain-containing protein [Planctomycetota bacterium]